MVFFFFVFVRFLRGKHTNHQFEIEFKLVHIITFTIKHYNKIYFVLFLLSRQSISILTLHYLLYVFNDFHKCSLLSGTMFGLFSWPFAILKSSFCLQLKLLSTLSSFVIVAYLGVIFYVFLSEDGYQCFTSPFWCE